MDENRSLASALTQDLGLSTTPIALAFVEAPPSGIAEFQDDVPSACTLWRRAEAGVFYAPAAKHFNCPIGAMTMGFEMPAEVKEQLMGAVGMMCEANYISPDEPAHIPSVTRPKSGIVYGPLADFPLSPDLVLMWVTPRQMMLVSEASGKAKWSADPHASLFGRPACTALPVALNGASPALSAGCLGMRTFTEISDDRGLAVLPGAALADFTSALSQTMAANAAMGTYYQSQKAMFSA